MASAHLQWRTARSATALTGDRCRRARCAEQPLLAQVRRVGEPCGLTDHDSDARATRAPRGELLDAAIISRCTSGGAVLTEDLRHVASALDSSGQHPLDQIGLDEVWGSRHLLIVPAACGM